MLCHLGDFGGCFATIVLRLFFGGCFAGAILADCRCCRDRGWIAPADALPS